MNDLILEVIATSVADAVLAQEHGADRLELISGIMEGGVTPSIGLIEKVLRTVTIPVHVMVRPHANSFCYDEDDLAVMVRDIERIRELGAAGVVLGALTSDKRLDTSALQMLLREMGQTAVIFHRAFDELEDQLSALLELASYPVIKGVLTSGGMPSVLDARAEIQALMKQSMSLPIEIMAGSGLSVASLDEFISQTDVTQVHMGTGVRINGHALAPIDPNKVRAAAAITAKYK
ncbi:copper homeostasis protein CutC [Paenibacillus sp. FA6]|uniref:copper homeostasis protein CutC n=1 Tax=Paenibacillus sp. FA6 TaxID=3413029 RepID=UPI003F655737